MSRQPRPRELPSRSRAADRRSPFDAVLLLTSRIHPGPPLRFRLFVACVPTALLMFYAMAGASLLHAVPPVDDYYVIAIGTNPSDTIGAADDPASGGASCTLRDALEIVSAGTLVGPVTGCDITLVGAAPADTTYVINLPSGGYTYTIGDMIVGALDINFNTVHVIGDTAANTIIQAFAVANNPASSLRVFRIFTADVSLYDLTVRHGVFSAPFLGEGAGIHATASNLTLDNVVVRANSARGRGAGIYYQSNSSSPSALNIRGGTVLEDNTGVLGNVSPDGAGLYFRGGTVDSFLFIDASTVRNNSSEGDGAGVYLTGNTVTAQVVGSLIQGNSATGTNSEGAGICNDQGSTLIVDGSTVEGNQVTGGGINSGGGGISNDFGGSVTLQNGSIIENNSAPNGGGLYNKLFLDPAVTVLDVEFRNNTAQREGGAIYNQAVATVGTDTLPTSFDGNQTSSFSGGAIINTGATAQLEVTNATFSGNSTALSGRGGAIENVSGATATVSDSVFDGNAATQQGGALSNLGVGSSLTINDSDFRNNSASTGGAIYGGAGSTTLVQGATTIGSVAEPNTATFVGGGIAIRDAGTTLTADATSIVGNTASTSGGGLHIEDGTINLVNAALDHNHSFGTSGGGGVYVTGIGTLDATGTMVRNNQASAANALGGGIAVNYFATGNPSVALSQGSQLTGNTSGGSGGGIGMRLFGGNAGDVGTIDIADASISGNIAAANGGGIYISHNSFNVTTDVDLTSTSITGNSAVNGGGIAIRHDNSPGVDLLTTNVSIQDNIASNDGGGVWLDGYGTPVLTFVNTAIDGNQATVGSGGGLFVDGESLADLNVVLGNGTRLLENQAGANGGAVYLNAEVTFGSIVSAATLQAGGVVFDSNFAAGAGGGIYQAQGGGSVTTSVIGASEFLYNGASGNGGASFLSGGTMTATGSLFAYNEAADGGAFYQQGDTLNVTGSCIAGNSETSVETEAMAPQTFTGNWWGSADGPGPVGPGQGDTVSSNIDFDGFLTSPPEGLACPTTVYQLLEIPTASSWALFVFALLLLAGGLMILRLGR